MIKLICKAGIVLGLGSLTLAYAATPVPSTTNTKLEEPGSYLVYKNVGTETLKTEKALAVFAPPLYLSTNEALQVKQLQNLITNQQAVMTKLGISSVSSWENVDTATINLFNNIEDSDKLYAMLVAKHSYASTGTCPADTTSIGINTYVANLAVLADQNEAAILTRLQTCINQDSLKQCGSV